MDMNRLDETKLAFDEATKRNLDAVGLRADRYQLAFLEGDAQGMQEQVDASLGRLGYEDDLQNVTARKSVAPRSSLWLRGVKLRRATPFWHAVR